jgi:hypothetical protein
LTEVPLNDVATPLPESLPVSVLMERRPGVTRWAASVWDAVGVTIGKGPSRDAPEVAVKRDDYLQLRYGDLAVRLHQDEAGDYYHNLMSPAPGCFIVAALEGQDDEAVPRPVLVTLSFDEAHAYGEEETVVYHVALPAELYGWVERFVLAFYVPEERLKRKLKAAREERGYGDGR